MGMVGVVLMWVVLALGTYASPADDVDMLEVYTPEMDTELDSDTRRIINLIIDTITRWPEACQNPDHPDNVFFKEIYSGPGVGSRDSRFLLSSDPSGQHNNFAAALRRVDLALGRCPAQADLYGLLFDLGRGLPICSPNQAAVDWITGAVSAVDDDIVRLGARLAECLSPAWAAGLCDAGRPSLLCVMVRAPGQWLMADTIQELVLTLPVPVGGRSYPPLRDLLHDLIWCSTPDIDTIHALIERMPRQDVDAGMRFERRLAIPDWIRYFAPYLVRAVHEGYIADIDRLELIFNDFFDFDPWQRSNLFYIWACLRQNADFIVEFLWNNTIVVNDIPEIIRIEFYDRCRSLQITIFRILESSAAPQAVLAAFRDLILPECLGMLARSDDDLFPRYCVACCWLYYMIDRLDIDANIFLFPPSDQYTQYYNPANLHHFICETVLGFLVVSLPDLTIPSDISMDFLTAYCLIQGSYQISPSTCLGRNLQKLSLAVIAVTLSATHNTVPDLVYMLKRVHCDIGSATPYFGPVLKHDPAAIGIRNCNQIAVLALVSDVDLRCHQYVQYLAVTLDTIGPDPVRALTWFASDLFAQQLLGTGMTDAAIAALESVNFYFSLADCIVDELQEKPICAVCLDSVSECRAVRLACRHMFCLDCIQPWLSQETSCPMCRAVHAHRLTRARFLELVDLGHVLPDNWADWPSARQLSLDSLQI